MHTPEAFFMSTSTEGIKPEPQHGSDAPDEGRAPEILSVGTKLADEAAAIFEAGDRKSVV